MYGQRSSLEAAVAAAAKLDADLHAKGKLTKVTQPLLEGLGKSGDIKVFSTEYKINDVPQSVRNLLCKGSTQDVIKKFSGASLSTRGRYISETERKIIGNLDTKGTDNIGLYLFIQGSTKQSVDLAVQKIEEMIAARVEPNTLPPPPLMSLPTQIPPPNIHSQPPPPTLHEKVPIGMENILPGFNLPMKLIGQGGSNLHYIRNETGAMVTLRGIGSAFVEPNTGAEAQEPLHFCIEHSKPEVLAAARDLAFNLIATVQQEYVQFQSQQPPPQIQHPPQTAPPQLQQVNVQPSLVLHQPGPAEQQQQIIQPQLPGVMATSISLPVVQTGFIQQPTVAQLTVPPPVVGVPPPHLTQPPPTQVALPPPGVHIPQQQGPLVPPPAQHLQIHSQPDQHGNLIQHVNPAQPIQPGQQQTQQQYVITQNGQPMHGIMTSQGLVVLNQQPQPTYTQQQVFLSQPPPVGQAQPVLQQGPLSFQQAAPGQQYHATVSAPVSYQLQYVQQNPPPAVTYSAVQTQQSQMQIQSPQHAPSQPPPPQVPQTIAGPGQGQQQIVQNQPPPAGQHIPSPSQSVQPSQRHSPSIQGPPNQTSQHQTQQQNSLILQQNAMLQNPVPVSMQGQIPTSTTQTIPQFVHNQGQVIPTQISVVHGTIQQAHIQNTKNPNEFQGGPIQPNQLQPQTYTAGLQAQQFVNPNGQVITQQQQVQSNQFLVKQVPFYQTQPVQIIPGQFVPPPLPGQFVPAQRQHSVQYTPDQPTSTQFTQNQNQEEQKPPKRKFTEEACPDPNQAQNQQGHSLPPQSLMSINVQTPQPVPHPSQTQIAVSRQGVGVEEVMQIRQQHLQQAEGQPTEPSLKGLGEDSAVMPPPPLPAGNWDPNTSTGLTQTSTDNASKEADANKGSSPASFNQEESQVNRDLQNREIRERREENDREDRSRSRDFPRRNRDRPSFSHYSNKPQMYDTNVPFHVRGIGVCPPPPPPPLPPTQLQGYIQPTNYNFYPNTRPFWAAPP